MTGQSFRPDFGRRMVPHPPRSQCGALTLLLAAWINAFVSGNSGRSNDNKTPWGMLLLPSLQCRSFSLTISPVKGRSIVLPETRFVEELREPGSHGNKSRDD